MAYIDREKFLKRLGEEYPGIPPHGAIVVGMLCDEEPADVRPVVRGRWLPDNRPDGGFWVCSNCKFPSEAFAADRLYKVCPNCGALMER